MIPIIIVCHNNGWMVEKTINDIYEKFLTSKFIIVDNGSTIQRTIDILEKLSKKDRITIHRFEDNGHPRRILTEPSLRCYTQHPYILTDPDLDLSTLPNDTINVLLNISIKYNRNKVGLALDISDKDDMIPELMNLDFEETYWINKIEDSDYELYNAPIDTTFVLIRSSYDYWNNNIRVAGKYKVRHLPFHKSYIDSLDEQDFNDYYNNCDKQISSASNSIIRYKCRETFKKNNCNITVTCSNKNSANFWKIHYSSWEKETFDIFDKYQNKDKIIIDIGTWIGPTVLYCCQKYKHVYGIEADKESIAELNLNIKLNNFSNITIIPKAIYKENTTINFGKNKFNSNSTNNDSCSQIQEESNYTYKVETITLIDVISPLNNTDIALIKVDIEGSEEHILEDLLNLYIICKIPIYLSFHYCWWNNRDYLFTLQHLFERCGVNFTKLCNDIYYNPFYSLLIE